MPSTRGYTAFKNNIGDLDASITVAILVNLYHDVLLGHDFPVENDTRWNADNRHLRRKLATPRNHHHKSAASTAINDIFGDTNSKPITEDGRQNAPFGK